jgi:hypothetical protein
MEYLNYELLKIGKSRIIRFDWGINVVVFGIFSGYKEEVLQKIWRLPFHRCLYARQPVNADGTAGAVAP